MKIIPLAVPVWALVTEGRQLSGVVNTDKAAFLLAFVKPYFSFGQGKKSVILAHANIGGRVEFGAALADNDIAGDNRFTGIFFHAKTAAG